MPSRSEPIYISSSRSGTEDAFPLGAPDKVEGQATGGIPPQGEACLHAGVRAALLALGQGVLDANVDIRDAVGADGRRLSRLFDELLRVVCRLAFLAGMEARGLLHHVEGDAGRYFSYWLARACAPDGATDDRVWESLRRVLAAMDVGDPERGIPALGAWVDPVGMPMLMSARIGDQACLCAIRHLGFIGGEAHASLRVDWCRVGSGDLATVYESLLEIRPGSVGGLFTLDDAGRGNDRRTSGSYYTPDSLVQSLLDSTLDPVMDRAEASGGAAALLALRVIDPACGGGHFLLAAARRMAMRIVRHHAPKGGEYRTILRDVVARCIYGVDCNPMAVELTRMALWIETGIPGRPLCFLAANILCGNALLGVADVAVLQQGVPDTAYRVMGNDDPAIVRRCLQRNQRAKAELPPPDVLPLHAPFVAGLSGLREMAEDTVHEVARKQQYFEDWWSFVSCSALGRACDMYVAAFMLPRPVGGTADMVPTTAQIWARLSGDPPPAGYEDAAIRIARGARVLHWSLAFADIMGGHGGFDVVIGNPPWEVMQLEEEEYFGSRLSEISTLKGAARKAAISALSTVRPDLFAQFAHARRHSEAMGIFVRASGRFPLAGRGKGNTYALFTELFLFLVRREGRAGLVVPTGIATDATTAPLLGHLVGERRLARLMDFENSAPLFPGVHRSFKFCLLTIGNAIMGTEFACCLTDTQQCHDMRRCFSLSAEEIARINPNTRTMPVFRSRMDAALTTAIYAHVPVFVHESDGPAGNPWGVEFRQGLFNMTSDSRLFRTAAQLAGGGWRRRGVDWVHPAPRAKDAAEDGHAGRYVPLYEAKMGYFYDYRHAGYGARKGERGHRVLPQTGLREHRNPAFEITPHYWVPQAEVVRKVGNIADTPVFFGFRNIMSPTNGRTFICNLLPPWGVGNSMTLLSPRMGWADPRAACLVANLSSLPFDFICRQKAGGVNLNFFIVRQLPVLPPDFYGTDDVAFIASRVLELTYTTETMALFARGMGYGGAPFAWDVARRALLRAELDAWYARAYGLDRRQLEYILDPHDVMGTDYPSQTFRVLRKHEMATYGEYRTRRLVLAAYDRLECKN